MVNQSKFNNANDNQSKYGNKVPYNNVQPSINEELAPILVTAEIRKDPSLIKDNIETWKIHGHRIPVAFAPIKLGTLDGWMTFFWSQVRTYIATGGTDEFLPEIGHNDDLSYDKFTEDADAEEDSSGFEPAQVDSFEDNVLLYMTLEDLLTQVQQKDSKRGAILQLLYNGYSKGEILNILKLGKSQGYANIKAVQELAKDLFNRE